MFGFFRRRRGQIAGGCGMTGAIGLIAYAFTSKTPSPAVVEVANTAPTFFFSPPAEILAAFSDSDRGVCYSLNGTVHGSNIGYSQCELPGNFYDAPNAPSIDPVHALLFLVVSATLLHAVASGRRSKHWPRLYSWFGYISIGLLTAMDFLGLLEVIQEYFGMATISSLPWPAAYSIYLVDTVACSLITAYLAGGDVSEVGRARLKLRRIITKRDQTIEKFSGAVEGLKCKLISKDSTISKQSNTIDRLNTHSFEQSAMIKALEAKLKTADDKNAKLGTQIEALEAEVFCKDGIISNRDSTICDLKNKSKKQARRLERLEGKLKTTEVAGTEHSTQVEQLQDEITSQASIISEQSSTITDRSTTITGLEKQIDDATAMISAQSTKISTLESDIKTVKTENTEQSIKIKQPIAEVVTKDTTISEKSTKIDQLSGELKTAHATASGDSRKITAMQVEVDCKDTTILSQCLSIAKQSAAITSLKTEVEGVTTKYTTEKGEWKTKDKQQQSSIASLTTANTSVNGELSTRTKELASARDGRDALRIETAASQKTTTMLRKKMGYLNYAHQTMESSMSAAHQDNEKLQSRCAELQQQLDESEEQRRVLGKEKSDCHKDESTVVEPAGSEAKPEPMPVSTPINAVSEPSKALDETDPAVTIQQHLKCTSSDVTSDMPAPPSSYTGLEALSTPVAVDAPASDQPQTPSFATTQPSVQAADSSASQPVSVVKSTPVPVFGLGASTLSFSAGKVPVPKLSGQELRRTPQASDFTFNSDKGLRKKATPRGYKLEHGIDRAAENFRDWHAKPESGSIDCVKYDADGKALELPIRTRQPEANLSRGTTALKGTSFDRIHDMVKSTSAFKAPPYTQSDSRPSYEDAIEDSTPPHDGQNKENHEHSASSAPPVPSTTSTESPVTTPDASTDGATTGSRKLAHEATESSPDYPDDSDLASGKEDQSSISQSSPSSEAAELPSNTPHTTSSSSSTAQITADDSNTTSVPNGKCYAGKNVVCKHFDRGTCVGNPSNYHPTDREWIGVMPPGVKRWGTQGEDPGNEKEKKARGTARTRKECCECYVYRQRQQAASKAGVQQ